MQKQPVDLNLLLPKFYPKSQQITLKLNPLLDNVRQTKIVSFHQLENKALFSKQLDTLPLNTINTPNNLYHKGFSILEQNQSIFENKKAKFDFSKTAYGSSFSSQKIRKKPYSTLQTPNTSSKHNRNRHDSLYLRSKTSDKANSKKKNLLTPRTPDFIKKAQHLDLQKLNLFIKNPESQVDFDDDLCNYIRLKMLTKNPYFSGGKFSKIKKHLVEQINLEQIQKKFFKSATSNKKYKEFFENIIQNKRQKSFQIDNIKKTAFKAFSSKENSVSIPPSRWQRSTEKVHAQFNLSKLGQNIERQDSPFSIHDGISPERNKKLTLKAKVLFGKSHFQPKYPFEEKEDTQLISNQEFQIEIQQKSQSPTLKKYLETRNKKFNIQKSLMKKTYRMQDF